MDNLEIRTLDWDVNIDVSLKSGITVLLEDSGVGKSFLFSLICGYFSDKSQSCCLINSANCSGIKHIDPCDILLLDNLDLYYTSDFIKSCYANCKYILCSTKQFISVNDVPMHSGIFEASQSLLKVRSLDG